MNKREDPILIKTTNPTQIIRSYNLSTDEQSRYVVIDSLTDVVVDNADGWGYKSEKFAKTGYYYKAHRDGKFPEQKVDRYDFMLWYFDNYPEKIEELYRKVKTKYVKEYKQSLGLYS